jgi:hypothetical protein
MHVPSEMDSPANADAKPEMLYNPPKAAAPFLSAMPRWSAIAAGIRTAARWCHGAGLMLAVFATAARSASIDTLDVQRSGARYEVHMEVTLSAAPARAFAIFTDYANLPKINPAVRQVEAALAADGATRVSTEVHVCVALYCRNLHQTQLLRAQGDAGRLVADVVPGQSPNPGDLRYGHAEWQFSGAGSRTHLSVQLQIEPAFWVPPMIGPWLIARELRAEAQATSAGIERLAAQ